MAEAPLRDVALWSPDVEMQTRADGTLLVTRRDPLRPHPDKLSERLIAWAEKAPSQVWLAERTAAGGWRELTYGEGLARVRAIGQAMLDLKLSAERPVAILSGNSVDHALVAVGAQFVGIPSAAISTAFSLMSGDHGRLRDVLGQVTPGLVFIEDAAAFGPAVRDAVDAGTPVWVCGAPLAGRACTPLDEVLATAPTAAVDAAFAAVGRETVAKFLFTSGTTGSPKAVIQTHGMLTANVEMATDCYAYMRDEPPVIVDWPPWSHVASGNKVFNLALYNGGSFYIDNGKPTPAGMADTIRNLREISPTWYFNVPVGYEVLTEAMETDARLRESFFRRLKFMMYAGAAMSQHTWDKLNRLSVETTGERVILATGLGSTETAPFALMCTDVVEEAGNVGVPAPGVEIKLVPVADKLEARVRGPSITPGYWRNPALTAAAFDDEGFYKIGDALRFAVPGDAAKGFFFDGRIAENFKLRTGTWVAVGSLRAALTNRFEGLVRDVVVTGDGQDELGAILLPFWPALRALAENPDIPEADLIAHPKVRGAIAERLGRHVAEATGSSNRVGRVIFLDSEPSFDAGEITDKGALNQRAVLRNRTELAAALYDDDDPRLIRARP